LPSPPSSENGVPGLYDRAMRSVGTGTVIAVPRA
jgi:hypothetical protein